MENRAKIEASGNPLLLVALARALQDGRKEIEAEKDLARRIRTGVVSEGVVIVAEEQDEDEGGT